MFSQSTLRAGLQENARDGLGHHIFFQLPRERPEEPERSFFAFQYIFL